MPPRLTTPGDILPEKETAGPPAVSTRSAQDTALGLLRRCRRAFRKWRRGQARLHDLSDRELTDIGLTRSEIDCIDAGRAIDRLRDGTEYLWQSRGVI